MNGRKTERFCLKVCTNVLGQDSCGSTFSMRFIGVCSGGDLLCCNWKRSCDCHFLQVFHVWSSSPTGITASLALSPHPAVGLLLTFLVRTCRCNAFAVARGELSVLKHKVFWCCHHGAEFLNVDPDCNGSVVLTCVQCLVMGCLSNLEQCCLEQEMWDQPVP